MTRDLWKKTKSVKRNPVPKQRLLPIVVHYSMMCCRVSKHWTWTLTFFFHRDTLVRNGILLTCVILLNLSLCFCYTLVPNRRHFPINSFSPELHSRPLDDTVKFIFNREIWICDYFATSSGKKGIKKCSAEGVYCLGLSLYGLCPTAISTMSCIWSYTF